MEKNKEDLMSSKCVLVVSHSELKEFEPMGGLESLVPDFRFYNFWSEEKSQALSDWRRPLLLSMC